MNHMLFHRATTAAAKIVFYWEIIKEHTEALNRYHDAEHSNYWHFMTPNIYNCNLLVEEKITVEMDLKSFSPEIFAIFYYKAQNLHLYWIVIIWEELALKNHVLSF